MGTGDKLIRLWRNTFLIRTYVKRHNQAEGAVGRDQSKIKIGVCDRSSRRLI